MGGCNCKQLGCNALKLCALLGLLVHSFVRSPKTSQVRGAAACQLPGTDINGCDDCQLWRWGALAREVSERSAAKRNWSKRGERAGGRRLREGAKALGGRREPSSVQLESVGFVPFCSPRRAIPSSRAPGRLRARASWRDGELAAAQGDTRS